MADAVVSDLPYGLSASLACARAVL